MLRRPIVVILCALLLGSVCSVFAGPDPSLIGWWWFDEGSGTVAADSSQYGNHGTLTGGPTWTSGVFGTALKFDGVDDHVVVPHNESLTVSSEVTVAVWINAQRYNAPNGEAWQGIIGKQEGQRSYSLYTEASGALHFSTAGIGDLSNPVLSLNEWVHACAMVVNGTHAYFINGQAAGTAGSGIALPGAADTANVVIGRTNEGVGRSFLGMIDDVRIYNRSLTLAEVQEIMTGNDLQTGLATSPSPADGATDVQQDAVLTWGAGQYAATHDVYVGTAFADVDDASRDNPANVLVSQGQVATAYDSDGLFEFGQTYYWRVDEVNAAPDDTIFKGTVWSFTVEPFSYPIAGIKATASSVSGPKTGPEKTVDGSGLDPVTLLHSALDSDMWTSKGIKPNWIQYEFDKPYKIEKLLVWNSNQPMEGYIGFGAKDVTIEYSTDGVSWTVLENVPQFTQASGLEPCAADTIDFGGVVAKYVKLTITTNWGGFSPAVCLSEVKFYQIPVQAREPQPADDATDVALDAQMNWRPGREATSHQVFFATDSNAVAEGLAPASTVTDHRYTPAPMDFGTTYYWKVDEIGASGTYEGDLWSFTSREFALIEDFESYNDDDNCIFDTWLDGYDGSSGSIVGYMDSANGTFGETTILHGGAQSMPLAYDNSGPAFFSETTREFNPAQNWTGSGATELCVWTRGYPALAPVAVTETAGKMTLTGSGRDIWDNDDQFTYAFKTLTGDGTLVARVVSTGTGTSTWGKGGVMIRDSLHGNSAHAMMAITTPGVNGASFQYRDTTGGTSAGTDSGAVVTVPAWVKIERSGDTFNGYTSADGKAWTIVSSATIVMEAPVQIGLCVTSHAAGEERTFEFESIATTGAVTGVWQGVAISSPLHNDPVDMYLTVEDSTGKKATATSATAVTVADWTRWTIPMSDLAPVSFSKVKKLTLGVGTKGASTPGPAGMVFIDDIGFGTSATQE